MPLKFADEESTPLQETKTFKITDEEKTAYVMEHIPKIMLLTLETELTSLDDIFCWVQKWEENNVLDAIQVLLNDGYPPIKIRDILDEYCSIQDNLKKQPQKLAKPLADSSTGKCKKYKLYDDTLSRFLEDRGIQITYNEINGTIYGKGFNPKYSKFNISSNLATIVHSMLVKSEYFTNVDISTINNLLPTIAITKTVNPIRQMVTEDEWDGKDYLEELYTMLGISADDSLSRILLRKWLHQALSLALYNTEECSFGADGCLVFNGNQGIGKTRFLNMLAMGDNTLFREGQTITQDKDTSRRCLSTWLCELGELEKTFGRISPEDLKAFITQGLDSYRLPYAKTDIVRCRRMSTYATCNTPDFLVDITGSRRYWVVSLTNPVDIEGINSWIKNKTARQLWLQVYHQYAKDDEQGFRLTPDERKLLTERNQAHSKPIDCEIEILDYLASTKDKPDKYVDKWITSTQIREFIPQLAYRYNAQKVGRALMKIGVESRKMNGTTHYKMPIPIFPESIK